jgi:diguanylate cyclase (GGDEF)-like protein
VEPPSPQENPYPPRLRWFICAIIGAAVPCIAGAAAGVALTPPSWRFGVEASFFLVLALTAEFKPVTLDQDGGPALSLGFVFVLASVLLFGWRYGVLIGALSVLVPQLAERRPLPRALFNVAALALAASAAAVPALLMHTDAARTNLILLTIATFTGGIMFVAVNLVTVGIAIALAEGIPVATPLHESLRYVGPALPIMASLAGLVAGLWRFQPELIALLAGPLFAVVLYQRSSVASRVSARDALTDSLTRLGNHRAFAQELEAATDDALTRGGEVSLCLVDVDQFKTVNDTYGHPIGDDILIELARLLRTVDGRAFRLGGDEFALLVTCGEQGAFKAVEVLHRRISRTTFAHREPLTISVGIGSCPAHAQLPKELDQVADAALYWAKAHGKNRSCVYSPSIVRVYSPAELGKRAERVARLRAAENLVRVVDAKDAYTGAHSEHVADLVERIGRQLSLEEEAVGQLRLAGLLHDVGKIAISDSLLQKPDRLTEEELRLLRTHSELGASLLDGMDLAPVDHWIRHHHEHWDGSGYPAGLAGETIPFGSRVILVADAYHAIVSDRTYRSASSSESALAELRRMAGVQFDPEIVEALAAVLDAATEDAVESELLVLRA